MSLSFQRLSKYSWFKIKTKDKTIHIDPGYAGYFRTQGIPISEFREKADLILVTHFHKDHCQPLALSKIRDADTLAVAPERCIERIGDNISNIRVIKPGDEITFDDIRIKIVDAYNTKEGSSTRKVHHKGDGVGYFITIEGKTIYHAGDTDFIPEMKELGNVDVAILPIGGIFTMDIDEAVEATLAIKPKIVIPMHIKKSNPKEFKKKVESKSNIEVVPLKIGEVYHLK